MTRSLLRFWVPGGVLWVAAVLAAMEGWNASLPPVVVRLAPYVVAGGGVLLGWRFNRSKLVFALLALFTVERVLAAGLAVDRALIVNAAGVLLPLNFAYYVLMSERGFVTGRGLFRLMAFGLQPFLVTALVLGEPELLRQWLFASFVTLPFLSSLPLGQPALCSFVLGFLLVLFGYVRRRGAMENAFLWSGAAVFMALTAGEAGNVVSLYLVTAGLVLVTGVIETAHSMAFRDELTGLPGRRALEEALLKMGCHYTVAMVDIDFFKKFNDTYGHDVGDQVLRMVAGKLAGVGGGGKAFRYGGEEFTILFASRSVAEAAPHLEELRQTVEASGFALRSGKRPVGKGKQQRGRSGAGRKVSVTVSIGVAGRTSRQPEPQQVIKSADKALYRAKKGGRNQVAS
ncbi:MAG: GGDEF domain-containing protein [Desulfobulbaceae bacterium]|nr:GGDEF domain-containing protein [Desulfobulbaceae bacterium]